MTAAPAQVDGRAAPTATKMMVPLAIGAVVSVALGTYGRVHDPTGVGVLIAGFSGAQAAKAWMASGVTLLALVQLGSRPWSCTARCPASPRPRGPARLHRWSGRGPSCCRVPVAVHCLYALGFQSYDTRVLVHSLLGCFFFGVFTAKMLLLPQRGLPAGCSHWAVAWCSAHSSGSG